MTQTATKTTKKKPAAKKPAAKAAPTTLDKNELKEVEETLDKKYSKKPYNQSIVEGSIANIGAAKDLKGRNIQPKYRQWNKRTLVIKCQWEGCDETRRIATSDLAQVKFCTEHTEEYRRKRRRELRAKNKKATAK